MRRVGLILLAVLALCLSSYLAATQSVAMAAARHDCAGLSRASGLQRMAHTTGHDMDGMTGPAPAQPHQSHDHSSGGQPGSGPDKTSCAWICAWACTAMVVTSALPGHAAPAATPGLVHRLADRPMPKGTQPPLTDRPPIFPS